MKTPSNEYRCNETVDLEELIKMKDEKLCVKAKAVVTWKSGRVEEIHTDLNKGGEFKKAFSDKIKSYKAFPTVEKVEVVKY
jgi:hypothetical protein